MVVLNKNDKAIMLNTNRFQEMLKNKTVATEIISNQQFDLKQEVPVNAKSVLVFDVK